MPPEITVLPPRRFNDRRKAGSTKGMRKITSAVMGLSPKQ
jgi:hypothetical protein